MPQGGCSPRPRWLASIFHPSRALLWTGSRSSRRTRRGHFRSRRESPPASLRSRHSRRAPPPGSRPERPFRPAPTQSSRSSTSSRLTARWRSPPPPNPVPTSGARGGDVVAGSVVVDAGARLGAWHVGALAAVGVSELECAKRPRVAVLATGSELKQPGEDLEPGQIFESNRQMLAALLEAAGAEVELLPTVPDDEERASRRSRAGARSRRARDHGRRLGRPARSRSKSRGRARRRGGVLGRRRQAREAFLVRRPGRARSSSGCPAIRCRRSSARFSSSRLRCSRSRARRIPGRATRPLAQLVRSGETSIATSSSALAGAGTRPASSSTRSPARSRT